MTQHMCYLAAPYTSADPAITEDRINQFCKVAAKLKQAGFVVISPLLNHLVLERGEKLPSDWAYWKSYSETVLARCDYLLILRLEGWDKSTGIAGEIDFAISNKIPVVYIKANTPMTDIQKILTDVQFTVASLDE